jgi:hypothetical protein
MYVKHKTKLYLSKQTMQLIAPTVILLAGFGFSAYYLNGLSGQASSIIPSETTSPASGTSIITQTSTATTTVTQTTTATTTAATTTAPSTSQSSSSQTTSQTSTSQTTAQSSSVSTPPTSATTTKSTSPSTTTSTTKSVTPTPTPTPTVSSDSPYKLGSFEDTIYKSIVIEAIPQSSATSTNKISLHISAQIPNTPEGQAVIIEIHSEDPIVIPTEVANGKIDINVNNYLAPGEHQLYIKILDTQIIRNFIAPRIDAASSLNSSQYDVKPIGIFDILSPLYIYLIAGMMIISITILFIMYRSRDKH